MTKNDNNNLVKDSTFLETEIDHEDLRFTYLNGFRFGFGFFTAWLLGSLLVVGMAFALITFMPR